MYLNKRSRSVRTKLADDRPRRRLRKFELNGTGRLALGRVRPGAGRNSSAESCPAEAGWSPMRGEGLRRYRRNRDDEHGEGRSGGPGEGSGAAARDGAGSCGPRLAYRRCGGGRVRRACIQDGRGARDHCCGRADCGWPAPVSRRGAHHAPGCATVRLDRGCRAEAAASPRCDACHRRTATSAPCRTRRPESRSARRRGGCGCVRRAGRWQWLNKRPRRFAASCS